MQLIDDENIIMQKANKGNVIVIIDKITCLAKMNDISRDEFKIREVSFCQNSQGNKKLDFILEKEEEI